MAPWNESEVPQASDMITLFTDTLNCLQTHLNGKMENKAIKSVEILTNLKSGLPFQWIQTQTVHFKKIFYESKTTLHVHPSAAFNFVFAFSFL